ncbi:class F sortase [Cohnella candidum]|uniref:Class F sortase n=1 Tax=Cohnella candidum TaxID=2674991 RepID=A0A3G3K421_9BACL|nr:class F sortase [Cohnella candidum]AYQ75266.1 class F sortase [Cohnella candidum]
MDGLSNMRKLFLIPIVCSLLIAGCGGEKKEPQASISTESVEPAASPAAETGSETPSLPSSDPAASPSQSASPSTSASPSASDSPSPSVSPSASPSQPAAKPQTEPKAEQTVEGIVPSEIDIPDIGVDADVISLGLTKDGAMDVPSDADDVGWFKPGYRPGIPGHAVVAGHVDSKTGPAVFYKLKTLKKGSKIILRSKKGEEMVFRVVGSEKYPYNDAPLEKIFGPSDKPLLNLITCTGLFSRSKGTHQERLVVTAELVPPSAA